VLPVLATHKAHRVDMAGGIIIRRPHCSASMASGEVARGPLGHDEISEVGGRGDAPSGSIVKAIRPTGRKDAEYEMNAKTGGGWGKTVLSTPYHFWRDQPGAEPSGVLYVYGG